MTRITVALLGAIALTAAAFGTASMVDPAHAQEEAAAPKKKGLKGSIGYRKAYSYSKQDVTGSDNRRFYDEGRTRQTPGGPFDSGFFFDSAIGRHGGDSPYMQ